MSALKRFASRLFGRELPVAEMPAVDGKNANDKASQRSLRITKIVQETPDSRVIWLEDADGGAVNFRSGQFITLCVNVAQERLFRSYSICTTPHSGELAIGVKRILGGRVSGYLNETAHVGQVLEARGPSGRFVLEHSTKPRRVCLIAGGSGITPLLSHARHLLHSEPESRVSLIYGNRSEQDVMFRADLAELEQRYPQRFVLRHVLSSPGRSAPSGARAKSQSAPSAARAKEGELEAAHGILDAQTIRAQLISLQVQPAADLQFLLCGPEPMMDAAQTALAEYGVSRAQILEERFTNAVAATEDASLPDAPLALTLRVQGVEKKLTAAPGETILDAALRSQIVLDFSCATGACGTCMARLVEGSVQLDEPHCLSADEQKRGFILPCVARCTSACVVEAM